MKGWNRDDLAMLVTRTGDGTWKRADEGGRNLGLNKPCSRRPRAGSIAETEEEWNEGVPRPVAGRRKGDL